MDDFLNTSGFKKHLRKNLQKYNGLLQIEQSRVETFCDLSVSIIKNTFPSKLEEKKEKRDLNGMIAKIKEIYYTSLKEQLFPFNLCWRIIKRILNLYSIGKINAEKALSCIFIILLNNWRYQQDFKFNSIGSKVKNILETESGTIYR